MRRLITILLFLLCLQTGMAQTTSSTIDETLMQYFQNQEYSRAATYLEFLTTTDSTKARYLSLLGHILYEQPAYKGRQVL